MGDHKKRKLEETDNGEPASTNSPQQMRLLLDPLRKDQLVDLLAKLGTQYPAIADEIRGVASADPVHRKLFVRGLAWDTTSEALCAAFCEYGEIDEGAVIADKVTGKSRGYGFITYKDMESAQRALREPGKLIEGRLAVCNLACEGLSSVPVSSDVAHRKLYVGGLSPDTSNEIFLNFFGRHGEIEEGSVTFDKETTKSRGFGFVTYKTIEAAKKAMDDPNKILGGRNITVKYADSKNRGMMQGQQQQIPATAVFPIPIPFLAGYPPTSSSVKNPLGSTAAAMTNAPYQQPLSAYAAPSQYGSPPPHMPSYTSMKAPIGYPYYIAKP